MSTNIQIKPVVELLNGCDGTHIDDLEALRDNAYQYASLVRLIGSEHIEIDFTGYTIPDINIIKSLLDSITEELGITFSCSNWSLPGMTKSANGSEILKDFERNEIANTTDFDNTFTALCTLVDNHLKTNESCLLDFSTLRIAPSMESRVGARLNGEELSVTKPQSILILIRLKSKYGGKLAFSGLNFHSNSKLAYALNYFTTPYCATEEDMKAFIASEYKRGDFVFINSLEIRHTTQTKITDYNPRRVEKLMAINDVFDIAEVDTSNLQLGLVVELNDDGISILPLRIESVSNVEELKKGRFKYTLMESAMLIRYTDLMCNIETGVIHRVIHGVDMTSDASNLYEIIKDLSPNPPRERNIYYSEELKQTYQNYLYSFIEKENFPVINMEPTLANIAKATDVGPSYYSPTDLI